MSEGKRSGQTKEYGDFQTPLALAREVCGTLADRGIRAASVLEPTCGQGTFLSAALEKFPGVTKAIGLELNPSYVAETTSSLRSKGFSQKATILEADFFATDWSKLLATLPDPLLVVGNPPWVTNAELGVLGSDNLPRKSNFQNHAGLDALTGKSNFDISEWMLIRLLDRMAGRDATLAMLCKTAVARRVLAYAWRNGLPLRGSEIHRIDAKESFGACVDACLLVCRLLPGGTNVDCDAFDRLGDPVRACVIGFRDARLLADADAYERLKHLQGKSPYRWRSGVKHDCRKVMEFGKADGRYVNGLGEVVDIENTYVYPMLKSSEVASGNSKIPTRWMLVPQRSVGEETARIAQSAPKTWQYLLDHAELLDRRASSIYRKRPRFSVFGVGEYTFAPWKVAISGFYKRLAFAKIGSFDKRPVVLDDTCYFVPCHSDQEADCVTDLLNSEVAREFFSAFVFWDAKRPITVEVLQQLDLMALAKLLGEEDRLRTLLEQGAGAKTSAAKQRVFF